MRRTSIVWKITIWYTIFLCILAIMVVSVTYLVRERILTKESKGLLIGKVEDLVNEIEYDDGVLETDDDFDFIEHGVYLSVYDEENTMLFGLVPRGYENNRVKTLGTVEKIMIAQEEWYVYETAKDVRGFGGITIRGLAMTSAGINSHDITMRVLLILSPVTILIGTIGGFLLTKRAIKPVNQMRRMVEQINGGKDLTRRIHLVNAEREIYDLGQTFDQMLERLEDAFEREKQFSSDASHELRTPVSVILSQCEYAMEQENEPETKKALLSIYQQTQRMSKIISQLLLLSRQEQGGGSLSIEEIELSELLEVIVDEGREKATKKHITIETKIEENIVIYADEMMIVRFFVNLISNAICYGKEGGWIKVELSRMGGRIIGKVADNGIGIAKEDQEKIWRRFYQVNPARTSTKEGNLGLGLSMVLWIVKAHQGEISLTSELGVGSSFEFWFPINEPTVEELILS